LRPKDEGDEPETARAEAEAKDKGTLFAHFRRLFESGENDAKVKTEPKDDEEKAKPPKKSKEAVDAKPKAKIRAKATAKGKAKATATGKAKAKAKAKIKLKLKTAKTEKRPKLKAVKKERVVRPKAKAIKVKKEERSQHQSFTREHFRHQVAFIEQIVAGEWEVTFGGLGTGIVGIAPKAEPQAAAVETGSGAASSSTSNPAASEKPADKQLTKDTVIVLFKNAPNCNWQTRNGKASGGYSSGVLDEEKNTLEWTSQRRDVNNKVIMTLVDHLGRGGRLLVAVRPPQTGSVDGDYRLLGQVSRIDGLHLAELMVGEGNTVIRENGSKMTHRAILPDCLNLGLKKGVGLIAVKLTADNMKAHRFCVACCYRTPSCTLHFEELEPAGVSAYNLPAGAKAEPKAEQPEAPVFRPTKRFRVKKAPREDEVVASQDSEGQAGRQDLVKVKSEPDS